MRLNVLTSCRSRCLSWSRLNYLRLTASFDSLGRDWTHRSTLTGNSSVLETFWFCAQRTRIDTNFAKNISFSTLFADFRWCVSSNNIVNTERVKYIWRFDCQNEIFREFTEILNGRNTKKWNLGQSIQLVRRIIDRAYNLLTCWPWELWSRERSSVRSKRGSRRRESNVTDPKTWNLCSWANRDANGQLSTS